MTTRLIELEDGTLVEVDVPQDQIEQISWNMAKQVDTTFQRIQPLLVNTCRPIVAAWKELSQEMHIKEAEVQLGLSFEAEGNLYVTKATTNANLVVTLVLKPRE